VEIGIDPRIALWKAGYALRCLSILRLHPKVYSLKRNNILPFQIIPAIFSSVDSYAKEE
jgi:hypothetical protein